MSLLSRLAVQAARAYGILSSADKTKVVADFLVVAGGGGGGDDLGGAGGAGGFRTSAGTSGGGASAEATLTLSNLNTYSVLVGAGGAGATSGGLTGTNGGNSSISGTGLTTITSVGGGGGAGDGGGSGVGTPNSGGSGGGAASGSGRAGAAGTANQGFAGGSNPAGSYIGASAGGGGAGAAGTGRSGSSIIGGNGGNGVASSISGTSTYYAGGGAGGTGTSGTAGTAGLGGGGTGATGSGNNGGNGGTNLGGGGGGGSAAGGDGGSGGSGIVIISYTSATPLFVGGTLTTSGGNQIHTFTSSGTLSPITPITASYLVVAGGGGGGVFYGGGGGAGGYQTSSTTLYSGATYVVTVGAGGAISSGTGRGSSGGNSILSGTGITTVTSTGGGGGGGSSGAPQSGGNGGSGGGGGGSGSGGAGGTGVSGQGFAGGSTATGYSGGGGGASAVGGNAVASVNAGVGGAGSASSISGTSTTYAGGGGGNGALGGAGGGGGQGAPNGVTNTGGGGQGDAGSGGSGIVIISYAGSQVFNGGLVTSSGGNTIHTFTSTGALTPLTNNLTNSLRFRSSASAYLSRTPTVAGSRTTWTWSGWVKRGRLTTGSIQGLFAGVDSSSNTIVTGFRFTATDALELISYNTSYTGQIVTTQVFRDPSAWYHLVAVYDTTQATAANRTRIYVNGQQVTAFSTATYPSQNYNGFVNTTGLHVNGAAIFSGVIEHFDGYMDDIYFIDGQALEPYFFGNNDANGVWKPIQYRGTYGTNGFYLNFSNTTSTTTLGFDSSPNGNNWTTNNISLTAGTTYDAMTDVPTNTSATVANYAVLNPVYKSLSQPTISNGNLTVAPNTTNYQNAFSSIGVTSGKWYCEIVVAGNPNSANMIGVSNATQLNFLTRTADVIGTTTGVGYGYFILFGDKYSAGAVTSYGNTIASGDIVGIALDLDNGKIWFSKNGTWQASGDPAAGTNAAFTGIASDTWFIGSTSYSGGSTSFNHNFGQRPFSYTPPTGFVALNTFNLPTPTILQGNKYMDATLYSGNDTTNVIVNQAQFKPDLVWIKARNAVSYHGLIDSVRGRASVLFSNATDSQGTSTSTQDLVSFNSNGFTLGDDAQFNCNSSGSNLVGWQWQAGQGTNTTNTAGSITSTVSANTTAGFSVVTYTGSGAAGTVGHGLGVAPAMIITKNRTTAGNSWVTWHKALTNAYSSTTGFIYLDQTAASGTTTNFYDGTAMTSSTFRWQTGNININSTSNNYVSYVWAEIAGFSRFGSYTGNGSTDGPFVYLGFRPKYLIIKASSSTSSWTIQDTARDPYNLGVDRLYADLTDAEDTTGNIDYLSNGFKLRGGAVNGNGTVFIYAAYAENPFKNANAR